MGRERRRRSRRSPQAAGSRSVLPGAVEGLPTEVPAAAASARRTSAAPSQVRSDRVLARESEMMLVEMKRVLGVSVVCFGMLAVLVVVERMT